MQEERLALIQASRAKQRQNVDEFIDVCPQLFYDICSCKEDPQAERFAYKVQKKGRGGILIVNMVELIFLNVIKVHRYPCTFGFNKIVVECAKNLRIYPGYCYYYEFYAVGNVDKAHSAIDYSNFEPYMEVAKMIKHWSFKNSRITYFFHNKTADKIIEIDKGQVLLCVTIPDI